jgi:hypothetical protein
MATARAIGAVGATLVGLIQERYPRDEFGSALDIELYQTRNFTSPMTDGISVFVYRVAVNATVRNFPPRRTPDGRYFRPSLPLDLNVMVTPWADSAQRHHRLLGWVMRMLEDIGTLTASQLNHYIAETDTFTPDEALEIVCEPLALADYFTIWDRLRTLPTSATYVLRMLRLDSEMETTVAPLVQTRGFEMGGLQS